MPFGWDLHDARLVTNGSEQRLIRLMRQLQSDESPTATACELNRRLAPTRNAGLWQSNAMGKILQRLAQLTARTSALNPSEASGGLVVEGMC